MFMCWILVVFVGPLGVMSQCSERFEEKLSDCYRSKAKCLCGDAKAACLEAQDKLDSQRFATTTEMPVQGEEGCRLGGEEAYWTNLTQLLEPFGNSLDRMMDRMEAWNISVAVKEGRERGQEVEELGWELKNLAMNLTEKVRDMRADMAGSLEGITEDLDGLHAMGDDIGMIKEEVETARFEAEMNKEAVLLMVGQLWSNTTGEFKSGEMIMGRILRANKNFTRNLDGFKADCIEILSGLKDELGECRKEKKEQTALVKKCRAFEVRAKECPRLCRQFTSKDTEDNVKESLMTEEVVEEPWVHVPCDITLARCVSTVFWPLATLVTMVVALGITVACLVLRDLLNKKRGDSDVAEGGDEEDK